jgi:hypothetical protein
MAQGFSVHHNPALKRARVSRTRRICRATRTPQTNEACDVHRPTFFHRMALHPRAKTGFAIKSERISAK